MYFKVAVIAGVIVLFTGCSNPLGPKPSKPETSASAESKLGVRVVEEVNETSSSVNKERVKKVKNSTVKEHKTKSSTKTKAKPVLKPEPFSLESNEEDPELLGPQSTLGNPLARDEEREESNTTEN